MKAKTKLLIIAIVQMLLLQLLLLQCTVAISAGNENEIEWQKTIVEKQYFKAHDSDVWEFISSKTTRYYIERFKPQTEQNNMEKVRSEAIEKRSAAPNCLKTSDTELFIDFNGKEIRQIIIFDVLGNVYFQKRHSFNKENMIIDLSKFTTGYYSLTVVTAENDFTTTNFVKLN